MLVSDLVNTIAEVYRDQVADSYRDHAASTSADVSDEAKTLQKEVLAIRRCALSPATQTVESDARDCPNKRKLY